MGMIYQLAIDANKCFLKNMLFQLIDLLSRIKVIYNYKKNLYIIMFIFFDFKNIKIEYNTKKEKLL